MALRKGRSLLRLRIKQAGLTQREFAKLLGVGESFVSMIISGDRDFTHERVVNAADILGCRVKDLNEWREVPLSEMQNGDE
jgi:transcriptional regulator with XRE-family HTH domain